MKRKSPIKHKVRSHLRQGRRVQSFMRGEGKVRQSVIRRRVGIVDSSFYELIGRIKTYRNLNDFKKFKKEFLRRVERAKYLYRGMGREEFEDLLENKVVESQFGGHFTLDFGMVKSWVRGDDDVVVRIEKPKIIKPRDYKLNDFYIEELEVMVPKGTKVKRIKKVFDKVKKYA